MKNKIILNGLFALLMCLIPCHYSCSLLKNGLKQVSKGVFKKSFSKVSGYSGKYGKYVFGKGVKYISNPTAEIKSLATKVSERHLKNTSVRIADYKAKKMASLTELKSNMKFFDGKLSVNSLKRLQKDALNNPDLIKELKRNPAAIKIYSNAIESSLAKDIHFLRYWSNNAEKFYDKGFKQFGKCDDFLFKETKGITEITDKTGKKLGKIFMDGDRYVIDISNAEKNTLTNLYPMANAKYIQGNATYITDKFGRVAECRVVIDNNVKAFGRDKNLIAKVRDAKLQYGADGKQLSTWNSNDHGGHLIADSWGGESSFLNIVPQNSKINLGGVWNSSETKGLHLAQSGNKVERVIKLDYPDNNSLRPSKFALTQKVNGSRFVDGGEEVIIDNM